ncbi:MAG: potassium channel protein [Bacteroidales bacterium]|nr:potassium channel protein [Bacteroidales bacterium]MBN2758828.1 potassium channel protein [Bacteroidales bacterium]
MKFNKFKYIYISFIVLFVVISIGVSGFMLIEKYSLIEAFYMTMITISTVGFGEVRQLSQLGMIFTSFLIIISFGTYAYLVTSTTKFILDGELKEYFKNRKMERALKDLKNHVIVCGYGRNGRQATLDLLLDNEKVLVIEKNINIFLDDSNEDVLLNNNFIQITGDAVHEDILLKSKIESAKALITTLPSDADNLFIVLTAKEFNENLLIISRATEEHSDTKLKRAGATNIIMPDKVGGTRMAKLVSQPDVVEFIESILLRGGIDANLEEIKCSDLDSCLINKSIGELNIRKVSGANLIGLKTADKKFIYNPSPETILNKNDKLFVIGTPKQVDKLKKVLMGV